MFDKMKELMEMKSKAEQVKRELDSTYVETDEVDGVKIVINGSQSFQSISIDENLLNAANKERLESDLLKSVNNAVKESQNLAAQKMKAALPGFPG